MEMICKAGIRSTLGDGVWLVELEPTLLSFFGEPLVPAGTRATLGVVNVQRTTDKKTIEFGLRDARIISSGMGSEVLVIDLGQTAKSEKLTPSQLAPAPLSVSTDSVSQSGDGAFLVACQDAALPRNVLKLGSDLLKRVREFADDKLIEGKARKWVAKPDNFLAITIHGNLRHKRAFLQELFGHRSCRMRVVSRWVSRIQLFKNACFQLGRFNRLIHKFAACYFGAKHARTY